MSPREWAEQVAASLPPLTSEQAADAGRIAAALDAKRDPVASTVRQTARLGGVQAGQH